MSTQNDLLNGNNNKNESLDSEGLEHIKMCSNWQDDSDNMFPYYEDDTSVYKEPFVRNSRTKSGRGKKS